MSTSTTVPRGADAIRPPENVGQYEGRALAVEMGALRARLDEYAEAGRALYWALQRIAEAGGHWGRVADVLDRAGRLYGLPIGPDRPSDTFEILPDLGAETEGDLEAPRFEGPAKLQLVASGGEIVKPPPAPEPYGSKLADWEIRQKEGPPPLDIQNPRVQAFMANAFLGTRQSEFLWREFSDDEVAMLEEVYFQACALVGGNEAHGYALYNKWLVYYVAHQPERRRRGPDAQSMEEWLAQMVRDCNPAGFLKQIASYPARSVPEPWFTPADTLEALLDARRDQYTQFGIRKS